jgi:hypothetical protein
MRTESRAQVQDLNEHVLTSQLIEIYRSVLPHKVRKEHPGLVTA